jgi:hypothetical protein
MPAAIRPSDGASAARAGGRRAASRRLELMAMTTGSVPMIIVGSGPPARWMALARNR